MVTVPGWFIVPMIGIVLGRESVLEIMTVVEMMTILALVTILVMVSILWMVTVLGTDLDHPKNCHSRRDYDCPGDGNIPRACLATLYNITLPRIILALSTKPLLC